MHSHHSYAVLKKSHAAPLQVSSPNNCGDWVPERQAELERAQTEPCNNSAARGTSLDACPHLQNASAQHALYIACSSHQQPRNASPLRRRRNIALLHRTKVPAPSTVAVVFLNTSNWKVHTQSPALQQQCC